MEATPENLRAAAGVRSDADAGLMAAAADEIERLRSMVEFLEELKRQAEAMREAAMRTAHPDIFPGSGRRPGEADNNE